MKPLDKGGKAFLLICGVLFIAAVAFRLNGSSSLTWNEHLHDAGNRGGLLLAEPQQVRSDEWMVWTPAAISQYEHGFPAENPSLGAGKAPFLYSLPVLHYTMCFRPQLWGFFIFDVEWGYAWYWNVKVFGLLASVFVLLWMLTRSTLLSLFGSLSLFFSSYVQWWFSCPPMLPEMISSWALALVGALLLVQRRGGRTKCVGGAAFVIGTANFILCLYPPFQIPLVYLGVLMFAAFLYGGDNGTRPQVTRRGAITLAGACLAVAALLVPFFIELRPTLEILSGTSYPGNRRSQGGELDWMAVFSGVMNFFNSNSAFPDKLGQPNGAANFYPLWIPFLLFTGRDLLAQPRKHAVALAALAVVVVMTVYALCPLPQWFCNVTLLSYCTEVRALLAIGVANVVFVVFTLPVLKERVAAMRAGSTLLGAGVGACLLCLYLWCAEPMNPGFLTTPRILTFFGIGAAILITLLRAPAPAFVAAFVSLLAVSNALVNPVMTGLDPLTRSGPGVIIKDLVRQNPGAAWAAFESNPNSEFLMALGATVISGVKTVPDLEFYRALDPAATELKVYNRYSFGLFTFAKDRNAVELQSGGFPTHLVKIHPLHPALQARGVTFFVFPRAFVDPAREGVELVHALPQRRMFIYTVAREPALELAAATL
jgi:hypothetical protein